MGFDLSGCNPKMNKKLDDTTVYGMIKSIENWEDQHRLYDALDDKEKSTYWKQDEKHHDTNPGVYFRNNVWWWRPLWDYVSSSCEDFLTDKDIRGGNYNDGYKISKTKALKISERLNLHLDTGIVDKYKKNHDKQLEKMKASEDKDVKFFANYPFDKENVIRFALFCKESGGFIIC